MEEVDHRNCRSPNAPGSISSVPARDSDAPSQMTGFTPCSSPARASWRSASCGAGRKMARGSWCALSPGSSSSAPWPEPSSLARGPGTSVGSGRGPRLWGSERRRRGRGARPRRLRLEHLERPTHRRGIKAHASRHRWQPEPLETKRLDLREHLVGQLPRSVGSPGSGPERFAATLVPQPSQAPDRLEVHAERAGDVRRRRRSRPDKLSRGTTAPDHVAGVEAPRAHARWRWASSTSPCRATLDNDTMPGRCWRSTVNDHQEVMPRTSG